MVRKLAVVLLLSVCVVAQEQKEDGKVKTLFTNHYSDEQKRTASMVIAFGVCNSHPTAVVWLYGEDNNWMPATCGAFNKATESVLKEEQEKGKK